MKEKPFFKRAIFKKHARLFFFMASRVYFSQRQIIDYSFANRDFRSEAVWDTKGKYKDILIKEGFLIPLSQEVFEKSDPDSFLSCEKYYKNNNTKKRLYLKFNIKKLAVDELSLISAQISASVFDNFLIQCLKKYAFFVEENYTQSIDLEQYLMLFMIGASSIENTPIQFKKKIAFDMDNVLSEKFMQMTKHICEELQNASVKT
ncbi:MAG: hypothetical protein V1859_06310 [archaeon]